MQEQRKKSESESSNQERATEIVGKGTIDGIVPFYFKDQGHRWMVRIGQHWTLKQEADAEAKLTAPAARNKVYWAIAQFRNQSRDPASASAA